MDESICLICRRAIIHEAQSNSSGEHEPSFHVAYAYHKGKSGKCISCTQNYPCETAILYGVDKFSRSEV